MLFDEPLPRGAISAARAAMEEADCLLVVGTSGAVSTATNMVGIALASGANCVLVNKEPWAEGIFDSEVLGPAEESLPELVRTAALVDEVRRRRGRRRRQPSEPTPTGPTSRASGSASASTCERPGSQGAPMGLAGS